MIAFRIPISHIKKSTNSIYAGEHWAKRKEYKDSVLNTVALFCRKAPAITEWPVSIRYRYLFESRALDTLNTAYLAKCVEDSFRSLGILPDDTPEYVRETILEVVKVTHSKEPKKLQGSGKKVNAEDYLEIIIKSYEPIIENSTATLD